MTLLILMVLLLTIIVIGLALLNRQLKLIRAGEPVITSTVEISLANILQYKTDKFYHDFGSFFHQLAHLFIFYLLVALRRLVVISRGILVHIEQRFSHLIDVVRGKGVIHKKGAVSLFLTQIKESK